MDLVHRESLGFRDRVSSSEFRVSEVGVRVHIPFRASGVPRPKSPSFRSVGRAAAHFRSARGQAPCLVRRRHACGRNGLRVAERNSSLCQSRNIQTHMPARPGPKRRHFKLYKILLSVPWVGLQHTPVQARRSGLVKTAILQTRESTFERANHPRFALRRRHAEPRTCTLAPTPHRN